MISTLLTELTANARLSAMLTVRSIVRMVVLSLAALLAALGMVIYLANAVHRLPLSEPSAAAAPLAGRAPGAGLFPGSVSDVWPPKKPVVFGLMFTALAVGFGIGRRKG